MRLHILSGVYAINDKGITCAVNLFAAKGQKQFALPTKYPHEPPFTTPSHFSRRNAISGEIAALPLSTLKALAEQHLTAQQPQSQKARAGSTSSRNVSPG